MRIREIIIEGGWDTTVTQSTVIKPAVVATTLSQIDRFVNDFNVWLSDRGLGPVKLGRPTGSASYYKKDMAHDPEKIYGDVDLQMIAPPIEGATHGQYSGKWNALADEFVKARNPDYVHPAESKPGHPIIKIGDNAYVQVDFMWHTPELQQWGAARVTPEHGVKGLLMGNLFSVLGELMHMSIQHAGVQLKVQDGKRVPFSKQKNVEVRTVTKNPRTFILDIFNYQYKELMGDNARIPNIDDLLKHHSGINPDNVKVSDMAQGIIGLANSFEENNMFSRGDLAHYNNATEFLDAFLRRYEEKAMGDINATKRDKATTPEARARADADKKKVLDGLKMVKGIFGA
jgi:hypothetical protein